jgi:hypothetical protein
MSSARWSLGDLHAFAARGQAAQRAVDGILAKHAPKIRGAGVMLPSRMNRLETAYAMRLELERLGGVWQWWAFEPITLRLAQGARYTPDFGLLDPGGHIVFHETKGHWREAALVRIKVAAELYPFFRFVAVTRPKGEGWTLKAVGSAVS